MAGVRYASFANGRQVYKRRRMEKGDGNRSWPEARASRMPKETYPKKWKDGKLFLKTSKRIYIHGELHMRKK